MSCSLLHGCNDLIPTIKRRSGKRGSGAAAGGGGLQQTRSFMGSLSNLAQSFSNLASSNYQALQDDEPPPSPFTRARSSSDFEARFQYLSANGPARRLSL